jgi:phosphoglycolate phosphatase-like HAD superfamily hydrolase
MGLILWDIDGTLIKSKSSKSDKHFRAFQLVTGKNKNLNINTAGMTDLQILFELLNLNGMKIDNKIKVDFFNKINELSEVDLRINPSKLNPGVELIIDKTFKNGWINGLLTGNTPERARLKLQNLNFFTKINFDYGYFGDVARNRLEMLDYCLSKINNLNQSRIIVVGDTPLDILTAQSRNLPIVAMATGNYGIHELDKFKPTLLLSNFKKQSIDFYNFLESLNLNNK